MSYKHNMFYNLPECWDRVPCRALTHAILNLNTSEQRRIGCIRAHFPNLASLNKHTIPIRLSSNWFQSSSSAFSQHAQSQWAGCPLSSLAHRQPADSSLAWTTASQYYALLRLSLHPCTGKIYF